MSEIVTLDISLVLRSPFLFQGLTTSKLGIDAAQLRNELDQPIIPADQVKGVLSAACKVLAKHAATVLSLEDVAVLFGKESKTNTTGDAAGYDIPDRGKLFFDDLVAQGATTQETVTRIAIENETGAVKGGALQIVELIAPIGKTMRFSGVAHLHVTPSMKRDALIGALRKALALVPAIGAVKSAGFGEIVESSLMLSKASGAVRTIAANVSKASSKGAERRAYRVTFDRPILVDAVRVTDNLYEGASVVPGGAFKGALATLLNLAGHNTESDGDWSIALAALRITHAFPENDEGNVSGFAIPHSVVHWESAEKQKIFGDALLNNIESGNDIDGLVLEVDKRLVVPPHPVDWKGSALDAFADKGHFPKAAVLPSLPRTHVAIDAETFIALDEKLHSGIGRGVLRPDMSARAWRCVVDFSHVQDEYCAPLIELLEGGIGPIGRTNARARFEPIANNAPAKDPLARLRDIAPQKVIEHTGYYALTLLTPALLSDPKSKQASQAQYSALIKSQTGGELVHSYTSRSLAGGYIATRRRPYQQTYYPFVLTDAGSVFLVKGGDPDKLRQIAQFGLQPVSLEGASSLTWRNCPYMPENGYGEVAFSLVDHVQLAKEIKNV